MRIYYRVISITKVKTMSKKNQEIINVRKINKMRWIAGIVMSSAVIILTLVAVSLNISNYYKDHSPESGLGTLRMFTTLSNLLAAAAAFMCLPFQIDGLKRDRYKLPSWIVMLLFIGAVGTFLTFMIAITVISISEGFVKTMFLRSNIFMHTINPIFISLLFTLIISDHKIKFKVSLFSLIPVSLYAIMYYIMVFATGKWRDVYQTDRYIPWPVTLLLIILAAFGISQLLRVLHNNTNKYVTENIRKYYLETPDYDCVSLNNAVIKLAEKEAKFYSEGDDIYIPTDAIKLLAERYQESTRPLDEACDIYLQNYLEFIKK